MFKKICIMFVMLILCQTLNAQTCPTVNELKENSFSGWQALNIDSATPLTATQMNRFTSHVKNFALAEWMKEAPEGSSHCFYVGSQPAAGYLGAYLAKANLNPVKDSYFWHKINEDIFQCHAESQDCLFN